MTKTKYPGVYQRESETRKHKARPDVCFYVTFRHYNKKIWEKVGWLSEGYSAKLAEQVRGDRIRSIRHGKELPRDKAKSPFFKDLAKRYLLWAEENKKSAVSDEHRYRNHLAPRFDSKRLDEIKTLDLERLKSELTKEKYSPATVKQCLILVRAMFNRAMVWGLFTGMNPIKGMKLPVVQNQRERFLSFNEANTLLKELQRRSTTAHDMALLSLYCGLRAGEIFNLRKQDLDFTHDVITILDPKNATPRRVYMTGAVKQMLKERVPQNSDDFVFLDPYGHKYNEMLKAYREITDKLFNKNVKDPRQRVTFHTLRHTFASWLALQGESLLTMRELLGHKSFAMTQRYAHLIPDEKRRAAVMLDKLFSEKRNEALKSVR
jgi:integrase